MRGRGNPAPVGMALTGTLVVHGVAVVALFAAPGGPKRLPPTYRVHLVAAPAPDMETRKAPPAVDRPAEERPAPVPAAKHPQSTVSRATPHVAKSAAAGREAGDRQRRRDGEHRGRGVPVPRVPAEHRVAGAAPLAAARAKHAARGGGLVLRAPRRLGHRSAVHSALRQFRLRPGSAGRRRGSGTVHGIRHAARRLAKRRAVRAVLFLGPTAMMACRRLGGLAVWGCAVVLPPQPLNRLAAQDTSTIDRGVRIGIVYRPGVRPGLVMLPRKGM